ncbi:MAG: flagellar hook-associated protein FlgK [Lachnospiraceae bacterium]|jgi:flagellar hook-associated protein 1 FlgK|nr:flagellar hook-associated protein FlgK [Lachnospiraceae bacterium]
MPSQFFGLHIAASGLRAANAAQNTTANNIANAQTVGYSRQVVTQEAYNPLRTFTTYGCAGAGVDTIAIERVRDHFYDVKYWNNNCKYGEYEVKSYYCKTIEDYFDDDNVSGFVSIFNKMNNALQTVIDNASSDDSKKEFISSAKALTDYFNNMYGNLQEMQKDLNLEIKQCVDEINSIAEKIATLNKQINVIELSGSRANELRDQRELLVDELSQLVDVDITEYDITDSKYPDVITGATRYVVQIAGGQLLVDGTDFNTLSCTARKPEEKLNQTDIDGLFKISWSNGNDFSLNNGAMEGKLKGLAELCYGNDGGSFAGSVKTGGIGALTPVLDDQGNPVMKPDGTPKMQMEVKVEVTSDFLKNMMECALAEQGEINIGSTLFKYSSWTFDPATNEYTFVLDNEMNTRLPDAAMSGKEVKTDYPIKYQGIPYYMRQMNTWLRGFMDKANEIFYNGYGNAATTPDQTSKELLFTGNIPTGGQYTKDDLDSTKGNGLYEITAGNVAINDKLIADASLLGTRGDSSNGVEECDKIKEMVELMTSKEKFSFRNGSAGQMLEMILADAGLNASNANTFRDTFKGLQSSIDNQRASISSVDEDEEAVNLVKFQNAYTLSSKMVQTLTEMYDRLILQTGV